MKAGFDKDVNVIPFTRNGIIDRLSGEVELHDEIFGGGADVMKYKKPVAVPMPQRTAEILSFLLRS